MLINKKSSINFDDDDDDLAEKYLNDVGKNFYLDCNHPFNSSSVLFEWNKFDHQHKHDSLPNDVVIFTNGTILLANMKPSDFGSYICKATNSIDWKISRKVSIIQMRDMVPRFEQNPISYLSLPTLANSYLRFDLALSVRPEKSNGLIFYNSGGRNDSDYIALGLRDSFIEFIFDLGGGETRIRSLKPINLNQWHRIGIVREKRSSKLKIDEEDFVTGVSDSKFIGLDLTKPLFVGGVPNSFHKKIHYFDGNFVGCIHHLNLNSKMIHLIENPIESVGITPCTICLTTSCSNGGVCEESLFDRDGYECRCPNGFSGKNCESFTDECYDGRCMNGGRCVESYPSKKIVCECPFGTIGSNCEQNVTILEPMFSNGAYLTFRTLSNSLNRLNIEMRLKPNFFPKSIKDQDAFDDNHLLFYCGQYLNGSGDFVAIIINNRTIEFHFDTGSGPTAIKNNLVLFTDQWINVIVKRFNTEATLTVDAGDRFSTVSGRSVGKTIGLNLNTPLYLGGYHRSQLTLPTSLKHFSFFNGCMNKVDHCLSAWNIKILMFFGARVIITENGVLKQDTHAQ
ncbi:Laminin G and EGF domain containing protein [Sarcoptes scabiei]|uniref:Laminin G and EGF domain containing protein n=1 Tax=Sarcoptes scabiei TaxID=52283 RepID=A0A132AB44_SARSC|nr:Laminin G and EGF domain containing protein [Sarcoptes scabiei]